MTKTTGYCHLPHCVFIDAISFSIRQNNIVSKLTAYVTLWIKEDDRKEVLTIEIDEYVSNKDMKDFAKDLRIIYATPDKKITVKRLKEAVHACKELGQGARRIVHYVS